MARHDIKYFKMKTGDEIVGRLIETIDSKLYIMDPMKLSMETVDGVAGLALNRLFTFTDLYVNEFDTSDIITIVPVDQVFATYYCNVVRFHSTYLDRSMKNSIAEMSRELAGRLTPQSIKFADTLESLGLDSTVFLDKLPN